ncbi:MAG: STAS/SEC14 domain-containing protein [Ginsengibacter sp.]
MIEIIPGFPPSVAAFRATGKITSNDYKKIINPAVKKVAKESGKINYLLILNTPLSNYSIGAWINDGLLGLRYLPKWNKLAIVSDKKSIKKFTDIFGKLLPSVTKGFLLQDTAIAKKWISE